MSQHNLFNLNVEAFDSLITPNQIKKVLPIDPKSIQTIYQGRKTIRDILDRKDPRLVVVVGPCSIHDTKAALEYAEKLLALSEKVKDSMFIAMRVYFEKPRTTVGWKGLLNDPHLNNSFEVEEGLHIGRKLLLDINKMGMACANETLDPIAPQYLIDLIAWSAIGARTSESQTHREISSGLSTPIGFKNGTDGKTDIAINALKSVSKPHSFLGINEEGTVCVVHTKGNPHAHIVLRGGKHPNYDSVNVAICEQALKANHLKSNIMIDASHANSSKKPERQVLVAENIMQQIVDGNQSIIGLMIESNLEWGNQPFDNNKNELQYGVSITDACIDWKSTEDLLLKIHNKLVDVLPQRLATQKEPV